MPSGMAWTLSGVLPASVIELLQPKAFSQAVTVEELPRWQRKMLPWPPQNSPHLAAWDDPLFADALEAGIFKAKGFPSEIEAPTAHSRCRVFGLEPGICAWRVFGVAPRFLTLCISSDGPYSFSDDEFYDDRHNDTGERSKLTMLVNIMSRSVQLLISVEEEEKSSLCLFPGCAALLRQAEKGVLWEVADFPTESQVHLLHAQIMYTMC
eukprot:gnl/MRDRNA2_/MRDRNA2_55182_c0_seq1.p1 gnl/MRDRNA2_/MRDRNA2_55182_c0~~gnl/MRDRNA2_/MRDRNA2_55182_c0_seq1.p1  ORF type:complete len:228 (+),score=34.86 gnl/MRDRNA2_/MRDRNA2_55182_c0_seq1:58-684(+)